MEACTTGKLETVLETEGRWGCLSPYHHYWAGWFWLGPWNMMGKSIFYNCPIQIVHLCEIVTYVRCANINAATCYFAQIRAWIHVMHSKVWYNFSTIYYALLTGICNSDCPNKIRDSKGQKMVSYGRNALLESVCAWSRNLCSWEKRYRETTVKLPWTPFVCR